jgi:hypothetical protein
LLGKKPVISANKKDVQKSIGTMAHAIEKAVRANGIIKRFASREAQTDVHLALSA